MRAGNLDRQIVVQSRGAYGTDADGNVLHAWSDVVTLRAQLVEGRTDEFLRGDQGEVTESLRVFRTRWHPAVTTAHRAIYEGEAHDIEQVTEIGRRRGLEVRCRRRIGASGT